MSLPSPMAHNVRSLAGNTNSKFKKDQVGSKWQREACAAYFHTKIVMSIDGKEQELTPVDWVLKHGVVKRAPARAAAKVCCTLQALSSRRCCCDVMHQSACSESSSGCKWQHDTLWHLATAYLVSDRTSCQPLNRGRRKLESCALFCCRSAPTAASLCRHTSRVPSTVSLRCGC